MNNIKLEMEKYWLFFSNKVKVNWYDLFLTNKFNIFNRDFLFWIVEKEWKQEQRYFYKSKSGNTWKVAPFMTEKLNSNWNIVLNLSKWINFWLSYETWTIVSKELMEVLENINGIWEKSPYTISLNDIQEKMYYSNLSFYDILSQTTNVSTDFYTSRKWEHYKNLSKSFDKEIDTVILGNWEPFWIFFQNFKTAEVKNIYNDHKNTINVFDFSTLQPLSDTPLKKNNPYLGEVQVHKYTISFDINRLDKKDMIYIQNKDKQNINKKRTVEIHFANTIAEPNLIWVENAFFTDTTINSFFIPKETLNLWFLVNKPLEYITQVPKDFYSEKNYENLYYDIRELTQDNPLIVKYKEIINKKHSI